MSSDGTPKDAVSTFSTHRRVDRKVLRFAIVMGVAGAVLIFFTYFVSAFPYFLHWKAVNTHSLSEISCRNETCDTGSYSTDWLWDQPDYLLDTQTGYFIDVATAKAGAEGRFTPLDYSDANFILKFRQPASYVTPDGEAWRFYSRIAAIGEKTIEVIVGYAMKAPSKAIETPYSLVAAVDAALKRDADLVAQSLLLPNNALIASRNISVDGFQVVYADTNQVLEQGPWVPAFLPKTVALPRTGFKIYIYTGGLYVAALDTNGRLLAVSFTRIGGMWEILLSCIAGFFFVGILTRALSRQFLRNYFAVTGVRVPSLEEALRGGENQGIEFKRGLSDDSSKAGQVDEELLKSIAAFANTNDGVIFVGIDDLGHIKGLGMDFAQRDRLERRIHQLARTRIRPTPPIQITFDEVRSFWIAKIAVAAGDAPPYMIAGTIYVRHGSSDVQAQSEEVVRMVSRLGH